MMTAQQKPTQISIEATIIRADGTVEELGTVAYYHRSVWHRLRYLWNHYILGRKTYWRD